MQAPYDFCLKVGAKVSRNRRAGPQVGWWMLGAFLPSLSVAWLILAILGTAAPGAIFALQVTARWSYIFFWLAYVGGALAVVLGPRLRPLARRGRELGLAFAAAMVPHTMLVAWLFYISPTPPMSRSKLVYFSIALVLTYLLALLSIRPIGAKLTSVWSRRVRLLGGRVHRAGIPARFFAPAAARQSAAVAVLFAIHRTCGRGGAVAAYAVVCKSFE